MTELSRRLLERPDRNDAAAGLHIPQSEVIRAILCSERGIALQSEVIRAIVL